MSENETFFKQESEAYNDETLMPFGKYKGEELQDVPDSYFLYLFEETTMSDNKLKAYIIENLDAIKKNCGRK
jgi:uncharacterized protein (DUF3820 family)